MSGSQEPRQAMPRPLLYSAAKPAVQPEEVQNWLEWAGSRLLSLHVTSPLPRQPRALWPAFPQDFKTAYGYTSERLRPAPPAAEEIEIMDQILAFVMLIPQIHVRRIVNARSLVTPLSQRHLYTWSKLALMLSLDRRTVMRLHHKGVLAIASNVSMKNITSVRQFMAPARNNAI